ncbi:MAG: phosphatidylglycerol lysyltransferase domain-containing protein [Acidobacteriota bacterium]
MATLTAWSPTYHYAWVLADKETLLISCIPYPDTTRHLLQPIGPLSMETLQKIVTASDALAYPLKIVNVSQRFLKKNPELLQSFSVRENRSFSNYLYRADALARLRGRKYSKKRNLLSQASKQYEWVCRPLSEREIDACFSVLDSIEKEEEPVIEGMLEREIAALKYSLDHFQNMNQKGLVLFVEDEPAAFSIYEAISPKTVAVHFERALRRFKGLYQVINWETAKIVAEQGYEYINREEDLGDVGLRDAKKSYHPIKIVPALELTRISHKNPTAAT